MGLVLYNELKDPFLPFLGVVLSLKMKPYYLEHGILVLDSMECTNAFTAT